MPQTRLKNEAIPQNYHTFALFDAPKMGPIFFTTPGNLPIYAQKNKQLGHQLET